MASWAARSRVNSPFFLATLFWRAWHCSTSELVARSTRWCNGSSPLGCDRSISTPAARAPLRSPSLAAWGGVGVGVGERVEDEGLVLVCVARDPIECCLEVPLHSVCLGFRTLALRLELLLTRSARKNATVAS